MPTITAIVITKNEAEMLANCLDTLQWCDEVIVIDNNSVDATVGIADRAGARVIAQAGTFSELRNEGLKRTKTDWILYVDADERVTPKLAQEIKATMAEAAHHAYKVSRSNIMYGHVIDHGGWDQDVIVRLFRREHLIHWEGDVHEHAVINGTTGQLQQLLVHFTHRTVITSLLKSAAWTPLEARLLHAANTAPVKPMTLIRKTVMEVIRRVVFKGAAKDGTAGWVEALTQGMNRLLVYMQIWELQQKPSIPDRYQRYEASIMELWAVEQNSKP